MKREGSEEEGENGKDKGRKGKRIEVKENGEV